MRIAAISVYAILLFVSLLLMSTSLIGNADLNRTWGVEAIVFTFVVMAAFSATLIFSQYEATSFSWFLLVQCAIVGGTLLAASLNHMFPERVLLFGGLHLITAIAFIIWNTIKFVSAAT